MTPLTLPPGSRLGPYEILSALGAGGMGEVYRARDTKLNREVAIKVLLPAVANDPDRLARFSREAQVLASLNHPNIAHIHGLEDADGTKALVLELVEGPTLADRIGQRAIPLVEALAIAKQITEALEAAHEQGIIHRDLKPANVKVREDGTVKVLDFGLAKAFDPTAASSAPATMSPTISMHATQAGIILGTAAYMSPEQASGKPADRRADIWSFGAVLYEMLAGKKAFEGESASDTLASVLKVEPDWDALPAATPASIHKLVRRCLTKDRKQRLQAIGEARIVLESPAVEEPARAPSRSRFGWMVAAAMTLVTAALGWFAWRATRPVEHPLIRISGDIGIRNSARFEPDTTLALGQPGTMFALSPDGTRLASGLVDRDGKIRLAIRRLDQSQFVPIPGTENLVSPFFSPDGQWIAFFADGKLKKVPIQGGAPVTLCDTGLGPSGSWGDDGNIILAVNQRSGLSRVPSGGGEPTPVTELGKGEMMHQWPHVLPGAQAVVFTAYRGTSPEDATIEVFSFKTHERKTLVRSGEMGRYVATSTSDGHLLYLQQGTLLAVPFDVDTLMINGAQQAVLSDVTRTGGLRGDFDVGNSGLLVYISGNEERPRSLFWLDTAEAKPLHPAPGFYSGLRFSPDGKRLAFASGERFGSQDIWVEDLDRDILVRVSSLPGVNTSPVWRPDGKYVVFDSSGHPNAGIYWTRPDAAGEPQRLADSATPGAPASFSPDGKRLAVFNIGRRFATDIWTAPVEGDPDHPRLGKPDLFLHTPPGPSDRPTFAMPAFSPDGHWIAYCSGETGESEVYVNAFPAGGKSRISVSGGRFPIWSPNGHELFFIGPDQRIIVVDYATTGGTFSPTKPRRWSQQQILFKVGGGPFQPYDLAPDGKRFAVILYPNGTAEQQNSVRLTFLVNFLDELRRRVPLGK